ncbi:hypothetical protein QCA50_011397 [Cerrena zonata]|uniref:Protein kinase domain-containing protein n=1 Tax=Cerrena zonata TaxID=2478898 RepID=A0AAW0FWG5_9APHY
MRWILDIANGLFYMHRCRECHGNLRGDKILISDENVAQITDIGMSRFRKYWSEDSVRGCEQSDRWTAPEVLGGANPSTFSDMFSFGLVCIEIFTEAIPFPEYFSMGATEQILLGERPSQPEMMPDDFWKCVEQCLHPHPYHRPSIYTVLKGSYFKNID